MAHMMKMTRAAVGHMFKHYERAKDEKGEYLKFGNQEIDISKTYQNYNLAPKRNINQGEFVKQRCNEVYCLNRKDVNIACSWIVTLPKDFQEFNKNKSSEEFFKGAYKFLEKRYKKENIISSYVHLDENTPHMHFCFVPVVSDMKKGYKVSAKECINKYDLQTFHEDLEKYLFEKCNLKCNILNGVTREGNKSIEELKRNTAIEKLQEALNKIKIAENELLCIEKKKIGLKDELERLEGNILSLQQVDDIKIKKTITGALKGISYEDIINLKSTARKIEEINQMRIESEQKLQQAQEIKKQAQKILNEAKKLPLKEQMERIQLIKENKELKLQLQKIDEIFKQFPELENEMKLAHQKNVKNRQFNHDMNR